jgi:hypothetical protein
MLLRVIAHRIHATFHVRYAAACRGVRFVAHHLQLRSVPQVVVRLRSLELVRRVPKGVL